MTPGEDAEGLVLRLAQFGESDRMASLLMADGARRELRVPQARASRKRFGGFDLYVRLVCSFTPDRKGRPRLQSVEVQESHEGLRGELVRAALAAHVAELLLQASQEDHPAPDLYRLALAALQSLARGDADAAPAAWARGFELKLLHVLGVRPSLRRDAANGAPLPDLGLRWSTTHGGALAPGGPTDARALPISPGTLRAMDAALRTPLSDQSSVEWPPAAGPEAERALRDFLAVHVGRREKARRFLAEILGPLALLLALTGCTPYEAPSSVRVQGWLYASTAPDEQTPVVPGVVAEALDADGALVAEGTEPFSDAPGYYRFSGLPPEAHHHYVFTPDTLDEHVPTVVSGATAPDDLYVDAGAFHLWPRPELDAELALLADSGAPLPTFGDGVDGGWVRGVVPEPVVGADLVVVDADGQEVQPLYLDDAGEPTGSASLTASGRFVVLGLPVGPAALTVREDGALVDGGLALHVVEDGVTSLPFLTLSP